MNYHCPNCKTNLKNRYMPMKGIGDALFTIPLPINKTIRKRIAVCPECGTPLIINVHPFDEVLIQWGTLPLVIFLGGIFIESLAVKVLAGLILFLGFGWSVWVITRPAYRNWKYWRVYNVQL
ncbi:hypothetical protein QUF50_03275 [Thiotrichales bacterium HSG1]|nr:hypothetical protein [Thiotrichales bacterium HSG1]